MIHLFKIIEIFNKFKIFKYHRIGKFSNIINLRKHDFLSEEKISERSCLVNNKNIKNNNLIIFKKVFFDDFESMLLSSLLYLSCTTLVAFHFFFQKIFSFSESRTDLETLVMLRWYIA